LSKKVTITRKRTIEEKVETTVEATDPEDAIAVARHLIVGNRIGWKYNRTIETSDEEVRVEETTKK
jgi:hypothetical protein